MPCRPSATPSSPVARALAQYTNAPLPLEARSPLHPSLASAARGLRAARRWCCMPSACPTANARIRRAERALAAARGPSELDGGWLGRALGRDGRGIALATAVPLVPRRGLARPMPGRPRRCPIRRPTWRSLEWSLRWRRRVGRGGWRARSRCAWTARCRPTPTRPTWPAASRTAFVPLAHRAARSFSPRPRARAWPCSSWAAGIPPHANQTAANGATTQALRTLDAGLAALRERPRDVQPACARQRGGRASEFGRRWRSTARRAATTAPAARPSCSAARSAAAACWPTGRAWRRDRFRGPRPAHHHRPARPAPKVCSASSCR